MNEYKNRFEKSLARINKYVEPTDDWTDEDYEHIKAVTDALKIASDIEEAKRLDNSSRQPTEERAS